MVFVTFRKMANVLKKDGIGPPYFTFGLPCKKKIWFDARGRLLATTTAGCMKLCFSKRWKKSADEMTASEYARAKKRLTK